MINATHVHGAGDDQHFDLLRESPFFLYSLYFRPFTR